MAIKANQSGASGSISVIDNTDRFQQGDMLVFDQVKNLFVKSGFKATDLSTTTALNQKIAEVNAALAALSGPQSDLATKDYVTVKIAEAVSGGEIDLTGYVTDAELNTALSGYQPNVDLAPYALKTEVFSGDYADLANKPDLTLFATTAQLSAAIAGINTFSGNYNDLTNKPVIFSGNYNDLYNQPVIPSLDGYATQTYVNTQIANNQTDLTGYATQTYVDTQIASALTGGSIDLSSYVTETELQAALANYQPTVDLTAYATTASLANVAFTGSYNDLVDLPAPIDTSTFVSQSYLSNTLTAYQPLTDLSIYARKTELFSGSYADLTDKPTLFSGSYNDLINKPVIFSGNYNDLYNQPIIPSIEGLASVEYVDQQIANVAAGGSVDLSSYVTETELQTALANVSASSDPQTLTLTGNVLSISDGNSVDLTTVVGSGAGSVDLTGYATQTYVQQQISTATLDTVANINDLTDVAIDGTETTNHVLMYNPLTNMWENTDLDETFATRNYVTEQVAQIVTGGQLDLSGYATENFVTQRLLERGDHFSGNYNDLVNRPQLFSGDYRDLINKPADNSDLRMQLVGQQLQLLNVEPEPDTVISSVDLGDLGAALAENINYNNLTGLPNLFSGDYDDLVNKPVLFSGNYRDLANKPYIPSIAGLATEQYVKDIHDDPVIWGDKTFKGSVTFEDFTQQKVSTVSHTATKRDLVMAIQTTNAIQAEALFSDGSRIGIANGTTAMFKVTFVASSDGAASSFVVRGIIEHTDAGIQTIGANIIETIADSGLNWNANISADPVNDALKITVTGSENTTVDWTIFAEISEVNR